MLDIWLSTPKGRRQKVVYDKILSLINVDEPSESLKDEIMKCSKFFCLKIASKWQKVGCSRKQLLQSESVWLEQVIYYGNKQPEDPSPDKDQPKCSLSRRGRPRIAFEEASIKTKKRRVAELADRTLGELEFAAQMVTGNGRVQSSASFTVIEALALMLDLDISVRKYMILRSVINAKAQNCLPSYFQLKETKKEILPSKVVVSDISAEVDLQDLLQKTTESIVKVIELKGKTRLTLICKWGFDGSSGHSQYKQNFISSESTDEFLFLTAMVPLRLIDEETGQEQWRNPRPSSTLYCRPIKFLFQKENSNLVHNTEKDISEKIKNLKPFEIETNDGLRCKFQANLLLTMMDGSVSNILSETNSTMKCIICGATPKEMNTSRVINRPTNSENYRFGLSTLHCWIRFFECLLHIGYRLPIKMWQVRGPQNKSIVEANKKRIQAEFKAKMALTVDKPKPGYGSSNDGNTARRFFGNPQISSEITGVDQKLIEKCSLILRVLASGGVIDLTKFQELLDETRNHYINLYKWYNMPSTIHKVLVHGCKIIDAFSLPIGELSEDALEARHKEVRNHRLSHTRKISRAASNKDLMGILLLTSDPFLASKRKISNKKMLRSNEEVNKYLKEEEANGTYGLGLDLEEFANFNSTDEFSD